MGASKTSASVPQWPAARADQWEATGEIAPDEWKLLVESTGPRTGLTGFADAVQRLSDQGLGDGTLAAIAIDHICAHLMASASTGVTVLPHKRRALGVTEISSGSNLAQITSRITQDGKLHCHKAYISNAHVANSVLLLAVDERLPAGAEGGNLWRMTLLEVPADRLDIAAEAQPVFPAMALCTVDSAGVQVDSSWEIGSRGRALAYVQRGLVYERLVICVLSVALSTRLLARVDDEFGVHGESRRGGFFATGLRESSLHRHCLATFRARHVVVRAAVTDLVSRFDAEQRADPGEVAAVKVDASQSVLDLARWVQSLYGAQGWSINPMENSARWLTIAGGVNDMLLDDLVRHDQNRQGSSQ
ncbi:acyl-CoA dehydrogenase family protein [Gordonia sp. VNK21]|uniref:acyl-CoA dehydrogenase family protein n=1 Tax=Gordonia sp. VNK21 TaxID=3382483 RepID=UPI0038D3FA95